MPETFPNLSVSDRLRSVRVKVDQLLVTIDECEAEIRDLYDSLRFSEATPSAAPLATESAPPVEATPDPDLKPSAPEPQSPAPDPALGPAV